MSKSIIHIKENSFFRILLGKTAVAIFAILGVGLLYVVSMSFIDHQSFPFPIIILVLALAKTVMISSIILKRLSKIIEICHSMNRLLWVFGLLIGISILSFATDYTCLYQFDHATFNGIPAYSDTYIYNLYHFIYFSVITFSAVGYGDMAPVSDIARFVVMLEIFLSFFIIVFALTNIKKIHIKE
ncbi:MAG: potassium channel family protein [Saprospiraceae bacterium]|nr:potassium channel family protein [Saprospiraceae bacterium]